MFHPIFCLDNAATSSRISEKLNNQFVIATHFEPLFVMPVQYFPQKTIWLLESICSHYVTITSYKKSEKKTQIFHIIRKTWFWAHIGPLWSNDFNATFFPGSSRPLSEFMLLWFHTNKSENSLRWVLIKRILKNILSPLEPESPEQWFFFKILGSFTFKVEWQPNLMQKTPEKFYEQFRRNSLDKWTNRWTVKSTNLEITSNDLYFVGPESSQSSQFIKNFYFKTNTPFHQVN